MPPTMHRITDDDVATFQEDMIIYFIKLLRGDDAKGVRLLNGDREIGA